jgi:nitric oxide reductase subunit B
VYEGHGGQASDSANRQTVEEFKTNRYDQASDTLTFTAAQSAAFSQLKDYYHSVFSDASTRSGLRPRAIGNRGETDQLTAFFAWSA